jgi:hypothetical protein
MTSASPVWNSVFVTPCGHGVVFGLLHHLLGHVHTDDSTGRPDPPGGEDAVHPCSAPDVQHGVTGPEFTEGERVADPGERLRDLGR